MNNFKQNRLDQEVKKIISETLITEIKDPRLSGMITVTGVKVTRDYSFATVYITAYDGDLDEVMLALNKSKGVFKRAIASQMKIRKIPELIFKYDDSFENGMHIEELLNSLNKED